MKKKSDKERLSERSRKIDIWRAYERLREEASRHHKVLEGLTEEFSSLQGQHHRLQEKTDFIEGLRKRLTALNERMDLLTKISQELNCLDLDRILDLCCTKIPFLVNAKYTSVYLHDPERDVFRLGKSNHDRPIPEEIPRSKLRGVMGVALERGEVLVIQDLDDFSSQRDTPVLRPYADRYATKSCIVAPLLVGDQLVGIINFADRNDGRPFHASADLQTMRTLVGILAASIRNVQLYEQVQLQASHDGLTGLLNHSTFMQTLEREVQRARRYKLILSVVLTDVDGFRAHNANLGHQGGDGILSMVARALARTFRTVDLAGRYGADVFAVILPETPLQGARNVAARALEEIRREEFSHKGRPYQITATAGVVTLSSSRTATEMLALAEEAIEGQREIGKLGEVVTVEG